MMRADTKAFAELLELLQQGEQELLTQRNQNDDVDFAEGYRHLFDLLGMGIEFYIQNDAERPRFVQIVSPERKVGGDNAHALYHFAPLRDDRAYRVRGHCGGTAYMGFTVYGGDTPEQVGIVANTNSFEIEIDDDGCFELILAPESGNGPNQIQLKSGANALFIRQYFLDDRREPEATFEIEPLVDPGPPPVLHETAMAQRIRDLSAVIKGWLRMVPMPWPDDVAACNQICPPFHTGGSTGHWSTPDNIHAFGFFNLAEDEALVLEGHSPDCLYWSCHLWNSYMQTYDYRHYQCAISGAQVDYRQDGSWQLVIARRDPGVPNWLDTAGHHRGFVYFRWLKSEQVPPPMQCRVLKLDQLKR